MRISIRSRVGAAMVLAASAGSVAGAVTAAPGWTVATLPTPGVVQGGVVRRDGAVLVGQGSFGAGSQSIVRVDGGGTTTIATGFNALGGFDLDAAGTLWVVDNCGECSGATTGDTLFAIPDALTRTSPVAAAAAAVLAAGSIPAAQDVLIAPDGAALVNDAAGPGAGRVLRVATPLVTGLDFLGGIALHPDGTLRVANLDGGFTGAVLRYGLDGSAQGTLAGDLSGAFGVAVDNDAQVLVTGGVADDFSSTVLAIAPDGTTAERARGFGFAGDVFHDAVRDQTLVLDFGASAVTVLCRDADGDTACDCPAAAKPKLKITKLLAPAGDEVVTIKGQVTVPAAPAIDPVATGARVRIHGAAGTLVDAVIPPGAFDPSSGSGWQVAKNGKFKWKDPFGVAGLTKMVVAAGDAPGRLKLVVGGKRASLAVGPADLPLRARIDLAAADGQCGELRFPGPKPAPACALDPVKGKVVCK
jgi:hypothetical protein